MVRLGCHHRVLVVLQGQPRAAAWFQIWLEAHGRPSRACYDAVLQTKGEGEGFWVGGAGAGASAAAGQIARLGCEESVILQTTVRAESAETRSSSTLEEPDMLTVLDSCDQGTAGQGVAAAARKVR